MNHNETDDAVPENTLIRRERQKRQFALNAAGVRSMAMQDVIAERNRQTDQEGWTAEHDDCHEPGELSAAGMSYAGHASLTLSGKAEGNDAPPPWPWDAKHWKPKGPRRDLVRAAALLIAEVEKIDRAEAAAIEAEGGAV